MNKRNVLIGAGAAFAVMVAAIVGGAVILLSGDTGDETTTENAEPEVTDDAVEGRSDRVSPRPSDNGDSGTSARTSMPIKGIEVVGTGTGHAVRMEGNELVTSGPATIRFIAEDDSAATGDSVGVTDRGNMPAKMSINRTGCETRISVETDASGQSWLIREGCASVTLE